KVAGIDEQVRDIDARIEEMERARREKREDRRKRPAHAPEPLGYCTVCGSPYTEQEARFCWSCGTALERDDLTPPEAEAAADDDQPTRVIGGPREGRRGASPVRRGTSRARTRRAGPRPLTTPPAAARGRPRGATAGGRAPAASRPNRPSLAA